MNKLHGGDIYTYQNLIDFSANINPIGMPQSAIAAAKKGVDQSINYPDPKCRELIQAISRYEKVKKNMIFCGNGAAELIYSICLSLKPRKALLMSPTFSEYENALNLVNCQIYQYNLLAKNDFKLKTDFLELLNNKLDIIFICNPNNPIGNLISFDFLQKLLEKCLINNTFVVIDECFIDFVQLAENYTTKPLLHKFPNLIILKAFTKIFAMPGLRLGYVLTSNYDIISLLKEITQPWNVSIPSQLAGIAALDEKDYLVRTKELIKIEREYLFTKLTEIKKNSELLIKIFPSSANFIFFQGIIDLDQSLQLEGFLIRNCDNFLGLNKGYYRIAVKSRSDNKSLVNALKKIIIKLKEG